MDYWVGMHLAVSHQLRIVGSQVLSGLAGAVRLGGAGTARGVEAVVRAIWAKSHWEPIFRRRVTLLRRLGAMSVIFLLTHPPAEAGGRCEKVSFSAIFSRFLTFWVSFSRFLPENWPFRYRLARN